MFMFIRTGRKKNQCKPAINDIFLSFPSRDFTRKAVRKVTWNSPLAAAPQGFALIVREKSSFVSFPVPRQSLENRTFLRRIHRCKRYESWATAISLPARARRQLNVIHLLYAMLKLSVCIFIFCLLNRNGFGIIFAGLEREGNKKTFKWDAVAEQVERP